MQKRIDLVTSQYAPELSASEQRLVEPFKELGVEAIGIPWDAKVNWNDFDAVILRSC